MIEAERLPRGRWTAEFKRRGCFKAVGIPDNPTGEWWRWPWPHACPFFIPVDDDGYVETWAMIYLFRDMKALAPPGWPAEANP